MHKTMQAYMDTLHTMTMLQDIPSFDRQDSSKLEDWFMDIEITATILPVSHTCLAEAKSCHLIHTLICEATQTGQCQDDIKDILRLNLCNANIHLTIHTLWKYNRGIMKLLLPICTTSKQQLSNVFLTMTLWQSTFLLKDFEMHTPLQLKYMKRTLKLWLKSSAWLKNSMKHNN